MNGSLKHYAVDTVRKVWTVFAGYEPVDVHVSLIAKFMNKNIYMLWARSTLIMYNFRWSGRI